MICPGSHGQLPTQLGLRNQGSGDPTPALSRSATPIPSTTDNELVDGTVKSGIPTFLEMGRRYRIRSIAGPTGIFQAAGGVIQPTLAPNPNHSKEPCSRRKRENKSAMLRILSIFLLQLLIQTRRPLQSGFL